MQKMFAAFVPIYVNSVQKNAVNIIRNTARNVQKCAIVVPKNAAGCLVLQHDQNKMGLGIVDK